MLGEAAEDYLKAIYKLTRREESVMLSAVADELGVSPPAVTKMVKRLQRDGLADHSRTEGVKLTLEGERRALRVLRSHRLLELFLADELGMPWEEVHAEAERLEHAISERVVTLIAERLGHPTHDPHGHPIPNRRGEVSGPEPLPLLGLKPAQAAAISRVPDSDADMLRYIGELGLRPGVRVEMLEPEPYGGSLHLLVGGVERAIGRDLAANIYVSPEVES